MEMHSRQSLYEVHGISSPLRRHARPGPIARRIITRFLGFLNGLKTTIEAEFAARQAILELGRMNDHMLRDLGITRTEIEGSVRRSRASIGMDYGPLVSVYVGQGHAALPTVSSPDLASEGQPEQEAERLRSISRWVMPRI